MQQDFDVPADWYESFFTGPVNRFWETMVLPEATKADLAFIRRHLSAPPPARILDVPCGAGRHALALARLGYRITGVDISADALVRAAAAAREEKLPADFTEADMRTFELKEPFDAVICLGNSIAYFDSAGMETFLARVAASLRPGGRLILDTHGCAESIFPLRDEREIEFDGGSYRSRFCYDPLRSLLKTKAQLRLGETLHELLYAHFVVTSGELVRRLRSVGLETLALYADTDDAPYRLGSPRLLLVAIRW